MNPSKITILRKIQKKPGSTQRELAKELGFSLGKLNYCLKALNNKDYQYKCKDQPMCGVCSPLQCKNKKFGIGDDLQHEISDLTKDSW